MDKKMYYIIGLGLVFVIAFNVVFFTVAGAHHNTSVWVAYGFIHFAYLMFVAGPFLIPKGTNRVVLGSPLNLISGIYFVVIFVVGLIIMLIAPEKATASVVILILITAVYAAFLFPNLLANQMTGEAAARHEAELRYVMMGSAKLQGMQSLTDDVELKKKIEGLYDLVRGSQVKSNAAVQANEREVLELIDTLEDQIRRGKTEEAEKTINSIRFEAGERNRRLKAGY